MKKLLFFIFHFSLFISAAAAQPRSSCTFLGIDSHQWREWNGHWDDDNSDRYHHHFSSLEIGFNSLRKVGASPTSYDGRFMEVDMARSMGWTFNLAAFGTRVSRDNTVGLAAAVGLAVNDYTFREPIRVGVADGRLVAVETDERLKKSKLNTVALHIPVVFEVNMGRGSFIAAGAYTDIVIGSHFKSKFPKQKFRRTYADFAQVGLTARAGWHDFYVYGNYGLTDIVNRHHGPRRRPFSVGIGVGF